MQSASMSFEFTGKIWHWRGPAPYYFVTVPAEESSEIKAIASLVTYGWGVIPVLAQIGETQWQTSLFPQKGYTWYHSKMPFAKQKNWPKVMK